MKEAWDKRYSSSEYIYGITPNNFLCEQLKSIKPGKILFPGDGEGRNSVFAARLGWEVHAFDYSESGKTKSIQLANKNNVSINYQINSAEKFKTNIKFDIVSIIYLHLPSEERKQFHKRIKTFLSPTGKIILECFSKSQINNNSGGPKNLDLLYSLEDIKNDFSGYNIELLDEVDAILNEGLLHQGTARVIRLIASIN